MTATFSSTLDAKPPPSPNLPRPTAPPFNLRRLGAAPHPRAKTPCFVLQVRLLLSLRLDQVRLLPFTMFLVWSLFANHHDSRNSHEEFSDVDKKIDICMRYKKTADKEAV
ncbi:hypothetical protein AB3S75_022745 [Citrus x aurantiifolia]